MIGGRMIGGLKRVMQGLRASRLCGAQKAERPARTKKASETLGLITDSLVRGDREVAGNLTQAALEEGLSPGEILDEALIAGMDTIGERFKAHDIFLPDVLLAAQAMQAGMAVLETLLAEAGVESRGKVVIGSVRGDLHDIGKNLVAVMLRGNGFDVVDLGNDVSPARFADAAEEHGATVVGMSALLTTTMPGMVETIDLIRSRGLKVATIVGGAPLSADFASSIGADAYGFDAANAVERVRKLASR